MVFDSKSDRPTSENKVTMFSAEKRPKILPGGGKLNICKSRDSFASQVPFLANTLFDLARRWQTIHEMVFKMAQLLQLLARDQPRRNSGKAWS